MKVSLLLGALLLPARAWAGYTHYFQWTVQPDVAKTDAAIADMKRIADARPDLVRATLANHVFTLNGIGDGAHEELVFPGKGPDAKAGNMSGLNFVKTAGKPYDEVVTACLLVARDHFRAEELAIHSDGDSAAWEPGRALYRKVLGREPRDPFSAAEENPGQPAFYGSPLGRFSGMLSPIVLLAIYYFVSSRGGGGSSSVSSGIPGWASYYLFWAVAPIALSLLSAHPAILLVVPVALIARPWLPDPILYLRYAGRVRALQSQRAANPGNVTARRDLALIWLEQRRQRRALEVAEEALARDPKSAELHYVRGLCLLALGENEKAVEEFIETVQIDPRFRYGDPYLRAADALMALGRWDDADDALERFSEAQRSSVEGFYKHALVYRERGDANGMRDSLRHACATYEGSPAFHRRKQLAWYLRARLRSLVA